jgi:hypothetical protein
MGMSDFNLDLHIGALVVHGLPQLNGDQLETIVRQELTRLFTEQGIPPGLRQSGELATLEGGAITAPPTASIEAVGTQIARSVYRGFGP